MSRNTKSAVAEPQQTVHEHGADAVRKAEQTANRVPLPTARRLPLGDFVRQTAEQAHAHHLLAFAGSVAFRSLLAIIPSLIALLWLLTALHARGLVDELLRLAGTALPATALDPIRTQVENQPQ